MALSAADYRALLQNLMPPGPAWPVDEDGYPRRLLDGLAQELARVDARIDRLIEEADPRTTAELLPDWERLLGLPSACLAGIEQSIEQRRAAVLAALTATGGQSRAYFIALAAAAGYGITITEFRPHTVMSACNQPLYGLDWATVWRVNSQVVTIGRANVMTPCNQPLAWWGDQLLECLIRRYKPAHTVVLFGYTLAGRLDIDFVLDESRMI